ncbi:hypothetical protein E2C01_016375 [Portunus trituberculatus]|uniref:Uncharacterized protein n=1 Tax=Portunus trituberculatus TaxID=210409 RepID=A0A5B7DNV9_PORTR|nr:hypothetical protein [Portunus trituberculatus]
MARVLKPFPPEFMQGVHWGWAKDTLAAVCQARRYDLLSVTILIRSSNEVSYYVIHRHHMGAADGVSVPGAGSGPIRGYFPKSAYVPGRFAYISLSDGESDDAQGVARQDAAPCSRVAQKMASWRTPAVPYVAHTHYLPCRPSVVPVITMCAVKMTRLGVAPLQQPDDAAPGT